MPVKSWLAYVYNRRTQSRRVSQAYTRPPHRREVCCFCASTKQESFCQIAEGVQNVCAEEERAGGNLSKVFVPCCLCICLDHDLR